MLSSKVPTFAISLSLWLKVSLFLFHCVISHNTVTTAEPKQTRVHSALSNLCWNRMNTTWLWLQQRLARHLAELFHFGPYTQHRDNPMRYLSSSRFLFGSTFYVHLFFHKIRNCAVFCYTAVHCLFCTVHFAKNFLKKKTILRWYRFINNWLSEQTIATLLEPVVETTHFYSVPWPTEGGFGRFNPTPPPTNSEGPPKPCQTQPDC